MPQVASASTKKKQSTNNNKTPTLPQIVFLEGSISVRQLVSNESVGTLLRSDRAASKSARCRRATPRRYRDFLMSGKNKNNNKIKKTMRAHGCGE